MSKVFFVAVVFGHRALSLHSPAFILSLFYIRSNLRKLYNLTVPCMIMILCTAKSLKLYDSYQK
jgi:hypothetical protein